MTTLQKHAILNILSKRTVSLLHGTVFVYWHYVIIQYRLKEARPLLLLTKEVQNSPSNSLVEFNYSLWQRG